MYFIHTCLLQTYYDKTQLDCVIFNVVRFRDFMSVIYRGLENKHYRKPKSRMDNQETPAQWDTRHRTKTNGDGEQLHQYQQCEQPHLTSNH
jgi:hypothetical protein